MIRGGRVNQPLHNADEQDAYTPWRYLLCYMYRPSVIKRIKRRTHKRARQQAKAEILTELEDSDD